MCRRRRPRIAAAVTAALVPLVRGDDAVLSYDEPHPGPGGWVQMDVVDPSSLSPSDFAARYVDTGTPVVLRRHSDDGGITPDWLREHCDMEGMMDNYGQIPGRPSAEWGGFFDPSDEGGSSDSSEDDSDDDGDGSQRISLGEYLDYLPRAADLAKTEEYGGRLHYAFDYDAKCSCPPLLDAVPWYSYFRDDYMLSDPEFGSPGVWPSLIVGPAGSSSALHVDNSLLPFHLTLLSGRKTFRTVRLADWRARLADDGDDSERGALYTERGGAATSDVDGFDDGYVEEEFIRKRGCRVYNATLVPGDTVYVPTGALHGALNLGDETTPAVAITSNVFTPGHADQLFEENCVRDGGFDFGHGGFCRKLAGDKVRREGVFREHGVGEEGGASVTYDFWEHALGRPGFCEKYRYEADCAGLAERCEGRYGGDRGETSGGRSDGEL